MSKAFWWVLGLLQVTAIGIQAFVWVELRQLRHDQKEDRQMAYEAYSNIGQRVSNIEGRMSRNMAMPMKQLPVE